MSHQKSYDGSSVVVHSVARGQSLSQIADIYRLPDWHCIWHYNTKIRQVYLGNDPDIIGIGQQLLIPRSEDGYNALLQKFKKLKLEAEISGLNELGRLESEGFKYKADALKWDFFADVATVVVTFAAKSVKAARMAKVATETVGQGRIAAQYLADNEAKAVATWLQGELKGKAKSAIATTADQLHEKYTGKATSVGATTHKTMSSAKKAFEAVRGYSMEGGKFALNVAEIALDYMSPTKLANVYLKLATGETVEDSFKNQNAKVKAAVKNTVKMMDDKIAELEAERNMVHVAGTSRIGRYTLIRMPEMVIRGRP